MKKAKLIIGGAFLLGIGLLGAGGSNSNETAVKAEKAAVTQKAETVKKATSEKKTEKKSTTTKKKSSTTEKKVEVKDTTLPVIKHHISA